MTTPDPPSATLPDAALRWIRARIGPASAVVPDDAALHLAYLDSQVASQVALDVVEAQLKTILAAGPSSFNVSGVYQEDYTATINGLQSAITRLTAARDSERATVAAGIDPWAPVTEQTAAAGINRTTSGRAVRACSSWDR